MEQKQKHLEFIQAVISRLAHNSFLLKGWAVTLAAALFAVSESNSNPALFLFAYIPVIVFWGLDGYYLWQEKLFRELHNHVRALGETEIDFSMNTSVVKNKVSPWTHVIISRTLTPYYGVLLLAMIVVTILSR